MAEVADGKVYLLNVVPSQYAGGWVDGRRANGNLRSAYCH
jgi:hypothetical protein